MHLVFDYRPNEVPPVVPGKALVKPKLGWHAALATGEHLMAVEAARRGFRIVTPSALSYSLETGRYTYEVQSSRDLSGEYHARTDVTFDGNTGAFASLDLPGLERTGDLADAWLFALHRADVLGTPYRVLVFAIGLFVAMLSITGVYIWWKKRRARMRAANQRGHSPGRRLDPLGEIGEPTAFLDPSHFTE